jgi:hypothetical protein
VVVYNKEKDFAEKIKNFLSGYNVVVDAIYTSTA